MALCAAGASVVSCLLPYVFFGEGLVFFDLGCEEDLVLPLEEVDVDVDVGVFLVRVDRRGASEDAEVVFLGDIMCLYEEVLMVVMVGDVD